MRSSRVASAALIRRFQRSNARFDLDRPLRFEVEVDASINAHGVHSKDDRAAARWTPVLIPASSLDVVYDLASLGGAKGDSGDANRHVPAMLLA
jgi:alpha-beta hydrolase superfamily lysophospholipase